MRRPSIACVPLALLALCACGSRHAPDHATAPREPSACGSAASLASQDQVAALAGCARVASLEIRTAAPIDLAPLAGLTEVSGDLVVGPTIALEAIHLDGLATVGGELRIVSNTALHGIYLPALERAGSVVIEGNLGLTAIATPHLAAIGQGLAVRDNHDLAFVDMEHLASVRSVQVEGCPELPEDLITNLRARSQPP